MTLETQTQNTYVFYKTYPEIDEMVMMTDVFWTLVLVIVAYLAFVLKIGPDFMKNRKPYSLKTTLLVYNFFQVLMSAVIVILTARPLLAVGIFPNKPPETDPEIRRMMALAVNVVYLGKFTELLDTIFFVFRKKFNQISFLHVYHHASVIIGSWLVVKFGLCHTCIWGSFVNANVHMVMYFYYFMAALGPKYQKYLTWKSYMTTFQIVQFVSVILHQTGCLIFTKGEYSIVGLFYVYYSAFLFFALFTQFYLQNYTKKNKTVTNGALDSGTAKAE